jgi:hypothetical protein
MGGNVWAGPQTPGQMLQVPGHTQGSDQRSREGGGKNGCCDEAQRRVHGKEARRITGGRGGENGRCGKAQWRARSREDTKGAGKAEREEMDAVMRRSVACTEGRREEQQDDRGGGNGRCGKAQWRAHSREATREAGRVETAEMDAVMRRSGACGTGARGTTGGRRTWERTL